MLLTKVYLRLFVLLSKYIFILSVYASYMKILTEYVHKYLDIGMG